MNMTICVVTGTRADYGLLGPLLRRLRADDRFRLQLVATCMHLSPEFGLTYKEIEADGFVIDEKVEMLLSADTDVSVVKSVGLGMIGLTQAFQRLRPEVLVVLGDRFEALAAATTAYLMKIPVYHLHGGELSEGATDDGLRHAITKLSYLHFTSTEIYRRRVIQLGEEPDRVHNVGAIGLDNVHELKLLSRAQLSTALGGFSLDGPVAAVTFHPVTLEPYTAGSQVEQVVAALESVPELRIVFTLPNADAGGRIIMTRIRDAVARMGERAIAFANLGQIRYLSLLRHAQVVAGNSSSGIVEAPTFGKPSVNIGDRQKGRVRAESVIDCAPTYSGIQEALARALSTDFQDFCRTVENPYGNGTTAEKIMQVLSSKPLPVHMKKSFYDQ